MLEGINVWCVQEKPRTGFTSSLNLGGVLEQTQKLRMSLAFRKESNGLKEANKGTILFVDKKKWDETLILHHTHQN